MATNSHDAGTHSGHLVIYRKTEAKAPRTNAEKRAEAAEAAVKGRFPRPDTLAWVQAQGLYDLEPLTSAEASTPALRAHLGTAEAKGFIVPEAEVSRSARRDRSTANSVTLWLKSVGIHYLRPEDYLVVWEGAEVQG
jgi:hypothetical protein